MTHRLRKSFHAVRLAKPGVPAVSDELPLVIYSNHPSWWDGALVPVLLTKLFPSRRSFAPIDTIALRRYGFMRRMGLFGVAQGTYEGASLFLRVGGKVLSQPDTLFYLTAQGRFTDARDRPVELRPGLAHLLARVPRVTVLPVALEYPFWDESAPEALVRFGEPMILGNSMTAEMPDIQALLQARLSQAMDCLAEASVSRDAARFEILLDGRAGVGGVYDAWRRLGAWRRGEVFDAAHVPSEQGVMKQ
ncbi:MAG TPA: lysophospholipid acyltransferase family protein [Lautropia sp.]|nr:lysophospholipid acyltransferase family protein [Lautropia sp.]